MKDFLECAGIAIVILAISFGCTHCNESELRIKLIEKNPQLIEHLK